MEQLDFGYRRRLPSWRKDTVSAIGALLISRSQAHHIKCTIADSLAFAAAVSRRREAITHYIHRKEDEEREQREIQETESSAVRSSRRTGTDDT